MRRISVSAATLFSRITPSASREVSASSSDSAAVECTATADR